MESLNRAAGYENMFSWSRLQARTFQYDQVLQPDCSQVDVYTLAAKPLVKGMRVAAGLWQARLSLPERGGDRSLLM